MSPHSLIATACRETLCVRLRASQPSALGLGCGAGNLSTLSTAFVFVARASFPDLIRCSGARVIRTSIQRIQAAADSPTTRPLQDVRADHRGLHVGVAEELRDGADVLTILEQMRGERVPECVA